MSSKPESLHEDEKADGVQVGVVPTSTPDHELDELYIDPAEEKKLLR